MEYSRNQGTRQANLFRLSQQRNAIPWYTNIAPVSWLTERDTLQESRKLNFSEWNRPQKDAEDAPEEISKGEMPF